MYVAGARLSDGSVLMEAPAIKAFVTHSKAAYPREAVGALVTPRIYLPFRNTSSTPERSAEPPASALARLLSAGRLRALCHSHPDGPDAPSEADMRSQEELEVPFVIVSCDRTAALPPFCWGGGLRDTAPFEGRLFRHGVQDCYALIRLWYSRERGVELPDYPRNWEWWLSGTPGDKNLYARYFSDAGFRPIDRSEARPGDVWLAAVRSDVPNHAGVLLDAGLCLHHPSGGLAYDPTRLSKKESVARWGPYITHWLRRD